jgi:hypothetical protein
VADVFGPGMYKLTTQTIPVLTNLKNWDKLFESPFKSDVILQHPPAAGPQVGHAAAGHDPRQGFRHGAAARLRHVFVQAGRPAQFFTEISGTRAATPSTSWSSSCATWWWPP